MDPLSQGALGAAAAVAFAPRDRAGWAGILGGLSGMAPDLDVLIRSPSDPLLFLEYHRQFTHSLAFIPVGALVCAVVLLPLVRQRIPFRAVFGFCLLGYATHGLLDACTSYGTQLLWPFSDLRVAWNNVSIIDPLFTLPVLALVLLAGFRRAPILGRVACAWAVAYLLLGAAQRERAESFGGAVAAERGHEVLRIEAKPAFGSLLLWKTIYETDDRIHVDALRLGWDARRFPGQSATKLDVLRDLPWLQAASQQWRDLERFRWFSDGNVALDPERRDHVIDVRYSLLPNRIDALWGIRLNRRAPKDAHVRFYTSRGLSPAHRSELFRMLFD
jgi:inner membrane protein